MPSGRWRNRLNFFLLLLPQLFHLELSVPQLPVFVSACLSAVDALGKLEIENFTMKNMTDLLLITEKTEINFTINHFKMLLTHIVN